MSITATADVSCDRDATVSISQMSTSRLRKASSAWMAPPSSHKNASFRLQPRRYFLREAFLP